MRPGSTLEDGTVTDAAKEEVLARVQATYPPELVRPFPSLPSLQLFTHLTSTAEPPRRANRLQLARTRANRRDRRPPHPRAPGGPPRAVGSTGRLAGGVGSAGLDCEGELLATVGSSRGQPDREQAGQSRRPSWSECWRLIRFSHTDSAASCLAPSSGYHPVNQLTLPQRSSSLTPTDAGMATSPASDSMRRGRASRSWDCTSPSTRPRRRRRRTSSTFENICRT